MSSNSPIYYKSGIKMQPILVVMPGFSGSSADFKLSTRQRFAQYGVCAVFVNMRGRGTSTGTQDCSGREVLDIISAVDYVKANYANVVDPTQVHIVGYSGGGGNALACAAKFPDYFNSVSSFFGISDYGHDTTDGWYQNGASAGYKTTMETWIGDTPTNAPHAYHARAHVLGITNYLGGHLYLFHDISDNIVPVVNTQNVVSAMISGGLSNYDVSYTQGGSPYRWSHGYPQIGESPSLIAAESTFINPILAKTYPAWTIPTSGTVTVLGYIQTKIFTIWLGGLTEAAEGAGLNEVATVVYNTATGIYTVTPLTGSMDVFIKQGALTASGTITQETQFTVQ